MASPAGLGVQGRLLERVGERSFPLSVTGAGTRESETQHLAAPPTRGEGQGKEELAALRKGSSQLPPGEARTGWSLSSHSGDCAKLPAPPPILRRQRRAAAQSNMAAGADETTGLRTRGSAPETRGRGRRPGGTPSTCGGLAAPAEAPPLPARPASPGRRGPRGQCWGCGSSPELRPSAPLSGAGPGDCCLRRGWRFSPSALCGCTPSRIVPEARVSLRAPFLRGQVGPPAARQQDVEAGGQNAGDARSPRRLAEAVGAAGAWGFWSSVCPDSSRGTGRTNGPVPGLRRKPDGCRKTNALTKNEKTSTALRVMRDKRICEFKPIF